LGIAAELVQQVRSGALFARTLERWSLTCWCLGCAGVD